MSSHIIVDLDNCIADDAWRIPMIRWNETDLMERYHVYHTAAAFDSLANVDIISQMATPIIFTARPEKYRPITEQWLARNSVPYAHLVMRPDDDHTPSTELKRRMLQSLPESTGIPWQWIVAAYDDRPDVVEMYRRHYIDAHVRAIHNVCAYTKPTQEPQ